MKAYQLYAHNSGVTVTAKATTLTGAKREASAWMTQGGGSVSILLDGETVCTREFWQTGNCFGWSRWARD